jgi:hypothetical protein
MPSHSTNPVPHPIFQEPVFNEAVASGDPAGFQQPHPSDDDVYKRIEDLLTKNVVGFEKSRLAPGEIFKLEDALGPRGTDIVGQIAGAGQIVFHALGDSGASNSRKYGSEINVADQLTSDAHSADASDRPAFLFHLGDVVYDFGESKFYYDQFYDPFRNYPAPIFAIPGNHDSFIVPGTPAGSEPLTIFSRNFCSESPVITPEAASLHRTAMIQPGVYFTLDAPFVRVIALFSNSLEDPGVISSEEGKWAAVPDFQLEYLAAQLKRIKDENYPGAVVLASHHPAFSYAPQDPSGARGNHGCSSAMLRQIDGICLDAGVYPHAFLSGHAHNYQLSRTGNGRPVRGLRQRRARRQSTGPTKARTALARTRERSQGGLPGGESGGSNHRLDSREVRRSELWVFADLGQQRPVADRFPPVNRPKHSPVTL